jgi:hypothetical protein
MCVHIKRCYTRLCAISEFQVAVSRKLTLLEGSIREYVDNNNNVAGKAHEVIEADESEFPSDSQIQVFEIKNISDGFQPITTAEIKDAKWKA